MCNVPYAGVHDIGVVRDLQSSHPNLCLQAKALKTLAAMCAQLISAMGTRLEDDRRILQSEAASENMQVAIRYRMQLKLFIQAALALILNKLKRLKQ